MTNYLNSGKKLIMRRASRPNLFGHDRADISTFFVEKRNAELKSSAIIKSEKQLTLEKPIAVAQWIAHFALHGGKGIAIFWFIFSSRLHKV
jgi:hypothetical protein